MLVFMLISMLSITKYYWWIKIKSLNTWLLNWQLSILKETTKKISVLEVAVISYKNTMLLDKNKILVK